MSCPTALVVITMLFFLAIISFVGVLISQPACAAETPCSDGQLCPPYWFCCEQGCCAPASSTITPRHDPTDDLRETISYTWYSQWQVLFLLGTLIGVLICCIWCLVWRRPGGIYMCSFACCVPRNRSEGDSAGSIYPPPRYSRCGSFHQAPPPYSEVTSKPDLYPLVITCGEGDGKPGGSYLMVHYFRNYVIRAPGSLSATSTAESLNSSFICNASNEANTMIPPPYSCASSFGDCRAGCGRGTLHSLTSLTEPRRREPSGTTFRENLITSPVQALDRAFDLELELIDCERYCDGGCKPRLGTSPPPRRSNTDDSIYDQEMYGIRQLFPTSPENATACESPPQPTSPTQSRDSTLRRTIEERRQRRQDPVKKNPKTRKSSLYMPLSIGYHGRSSRISPGSRMSSRSAPATPCGALVPNLLTFTQRVSASRLSSRSSRLEEENDPLLADIESARTDHKF